MVSRVFVVYFRSSDTHLIVCKTGLTFNIHVSTNTCVTGNNVIMHKVLVMCTVTPTEQQRMVVTVIKSATEDGSYSY